MKRAVLAGVLIATLASPGWAALSLGTPFSQRMVLQREQPLPVWGWAETGRTITVSIAGVSRSVQANAQGRWEVELPALSAGGPHELVVSGDGEIRLQDVLVGEVWICSGQSNMAMPLQDTTNAAAEIAAANYPNIRFQALPVSGSGLPRDRLSQTVNWTICSPATAGGMSAVAYFFGREVHTNISIPVGLIVVATGATPIENWVPREGLDRVPELADTAAAAHQADTNYSAALADYEAAVARGESPPVPVHPYMVPDNPYRSLGTLYNGSVAPVARVAMRGMIWYQGESNRGDLSPYYFNFHKALVHGWRATWERGAFPFYYAQISALDSWRPNWQIPEIWEGQRWVMSMTNTGMAVIHDLVTDLTKIHPLEKVEVGRRLAFWALARNYGFTSLPYSGPLYRTHQLSGSNIVLSFDYAFGGLKARNGGALDWFTIAGTNGVFVPAQTRIEGNRIVVWSSQVAQPKWVQFAWDETAQPNLVNGAGLPASPFRTPDEAPVQEPIARWSAEAAEWIAGGREFYVAPDGQAANSGTLDQPWDLRSTLQGQHGLVGGDLVWVRGGVYTGCFTTAISGSPGKPIVVRAMPGERAVLDGPLSGGETYILELHASTAWCVFWGLEIMVSNPSNIDDLRPSGFWFNGANSKLVNCHIHDANCNGFWSPAVDSEIYGCLIYNIGGQTVGRGQGNGHNIYTQNATGTKRIRDNIIFNGFRNGIQVYTTYGTIDGYDLIGNTLFGASACANEGDKKMDIVIGGYSPASRILVKENLGWANGLARHCEFGYASSTGSLDITLLDNVFAGEVVLRYWQTVAMSGNKFYSSFSGVNPADYPDNRYGGAPSTNVVFVRPNAYEPGRANITVYNWSNGDTVPVDINAVAPVGTAFEIRNAQNWHAGPVLSGIADGGPVSLPMTGMDPVQPIGANGYITPAEMSGKAFNVFVLLSSSPGDGVYTVTFDSQGGSAPVPFSILVTNGLPYGPLAATSRAGYTLDGWRSAPGGAGAEIVAGDTVALAANQTLYAKWAPNLYTVAFDSQGGSTPVPASILVTNGLPYGPLAATTRAGFALNGWWTEPGGGGVEVRANDTVDPTANRTLYAKWTDLQVNAARLPYTESFEGWTPGALVNGQASWAGEAGDTSTVVGVGPYAAPPCGTPLGGAHDRVLSLHTGSGILTNELYDTDISGNTPFLDTMMRFTLSDNPPPACGSADHGLKLTVFANMSSNLVVYHGVTDPATGDLLANTNDATGLLVNTGQWRRLTVRFDATLAAPAHLPGVEMFQVRLDGVLVTNANAYADDWRTSWSTAQAPPSVSAAGTWFRSATKTSPKTLRSLGFQGSGFVDDLTVTMTDPFGAPSSHYWVLAVTASAGGAVSPEPGLYPVPVGEGTNVVAAAADWRRIQSLTTNGAPVAAAVDRKRYTNAVPSAGSGQTGTVDVVFGSPLNSAWYAGVPNAWLSGFGLSEADAAGDSNLPLDYLLDIDPRAVYVPTLDIVSLRLAETGMALVVQLKTNDAPKDTIIRGYLRLSGADTVAGPYTNLAGSTRTNVPFRGGGYATNQVPGPAAPNRFYKAVISDAP